VFKFRFVQDFERAALIAPALLDVLGELLEPQAASRSTMPAASATAATVLMDLI
jgi:hypothetical protein